MGSLDTFLGTAMHRPPVQVHDGLAHWRGSTEVHLSCSARFVPSRKETNMLTFSPPGTSDEGKYSSDGSSGS